MEARRRTHIDSWAEMSVVTKDSISEAIAYSLQNSLYSNAIFLAERSYATSPNAESMFVLATCYHRNSQPLRAISVLRDAPRSDDIRYLLAICCYEAGQLNEAEAALQQEKRRGAGSQVPNGAAGEHLLAQIYRKTGRRSLAIVHFRKSLELNPLLWSSYEALCELGADIDPSEVYAMPTSLNETMPVTPAAAFSLVTPSPVGRPLFATTPVHSMAGTPAAETPSPNFFATPTPKTGPPAAPAPKRRLDPRKTRARYSLVSNSTPLPIGTPINSEMPALSNHTEVDQSPAAIFFLLASALRSLALYQCQDAIETFYRLPQSHFSSPFVQTCLGRAFFELCDYRSAEQAFELARRMDPTRAEGMATYSSVLWHLKRDASLAALGRSLSEVDSTHPETWCTIGNCFALQSDHESAIKLFERAITLNPSFVYAYTLLGHEYVTMEEFDKALAAFRSALGFDERHYNAWYGLGTIYFRQEKYDLAEYHFRRALAINGNNSVLLCYLGMAQMAQEKYDLALDSLSIAVDLDPTNPLARFKRATLLVNMGEDENALKELESLKTVASKESAIYMLLGRLYKRMGRLSEALQNYTIAADLDPKDSVTIRAAIESIHLAEGDEL